MSYQDGGDGIETYEDLLRRLQALTPDQRKQRVQVARAPADYSEVVALDPVVGLYAVDEAGFDYARSSVDNRRHGDELVLVYDANLFAKDGAIAYEMDAEDLIFDKPIYPPGHDDSADWTGPAQKLAGARSD